MHIVYTLTQQKTPPEIGKYTVLASHQFAIVVEHYQYTVYKTWCGNEQSSQYV